MTLNRRTFAKTAAWATPAVLATSVVPAYAASANTYNREELEKSLQGLILVRDYCDDYGTYRISVEGRDYQNTGLPLGYSVGGTKQNSVITGASITLYISNNINPTWVAQADHSPSWSQLTRDTSVPAIAGHTAYTTRYLANNWTYDSATGSHSILEYPHFVYNGRVYGCPTGTAYSLRRVTVDGELFELRRGPGTLFYRAR